MACNAEALDAAIKEECHFSRSALRSLAGQVEMAVGGLTFCTGRTSLDQMILRIRQRYQYYTDRNVDGGNCPH